MFTFQTAITQAVTQAAVDAAKAGVQAMAAAPDESSSGVRSETIISGPKLFGSTFDWDSVEK